MVAQNFQTSELHHINLLTIQEFADWAKVGSKIVYRWISEFHRSIEPIINARWYVFLKT